MFRGSNGMTNRVCGKRFDFQSFIPGFVISNTANFAPVGSTEGVIFITMKFGQHFRLFASRTNFHRFIHRKFSNRSTALLSIGSAAAIVF